MSHTLNAGGELEAENSLLCFRSYHRNIANGNFKGINVLWENEKLGCCSFVIAHVYILDRWYRRITLSVSFFSLSLNLCKNLKFFLVWCVAMLCLFFYKAKQLLWIKVLAVNCSVLTLYLILETVEQYFVRKGFNKTITADETNETWSLCEDTCFNVDCIVNDSIFYLKAARLKIMKYNKISTKKTTFVCLL